MASALLERPKSGSVSNLEDSSERWASFILRHVSMKIDAPASSAIRFLERRRAGGLAEQVGKALDDYREVLGLAMGDIYAKWSPILPTADPETNLAWGKPELIEVFLAVAESHAIRPFGRDMAAFERSAVKNAREVKAALVGHLSRMRTAGSHEDLAGEAKSLEGEIRLLGEGLRKELADIGQSVPKLQASIKTQSPQLRL